MSSSADTRVLGEGKVGAASPGLPLRAVVAGEGSGLGVFARDARVLLGAGVCLADMAVIAISGAAASWARHLVLDVPLQYELAILVNCVLTQQAFSLAKLYDFRSLTRPLLQVGRIALACTCVLLVLTGITYFAKTGGDFARGWVMLWFLGSFSGLVAIRLITALHIERSAAARYTLHVVVVGPAIVAERIAREIEASDPFVTVVGIFRSGPHAADTVEGLISLARFRRVDEIVVVVASARGLELGTMLRKLSVIAADVRLLPYVAELNRAADVARSTVALYERPLAGWNTIVKRAMDLAFSSLLLALLAPLMLTIAAAVRLDSRGPALFRQVRYGLNNRPFLVYKFRTMYHELPPDPMVRQARRGDARVTRVGRFLRQTSLDELPQLLNVLRGEMSLVGPRPHAAVHNQCYAQVIEEYLSRHRVKPGITGWAQVNGLRGETDTVEKMRRRVQYDLHYIENWSAAFDLAILLRTIIIGFDRRTAY